VRGLRAMSRESLCQLLGAQSGARLFRFARGQDERELGQAASEIGEGGAEGRQRQSIGVDLTYGVRFSTEPKILVFIQDVAKELVERMKAAHVKGKKVISFFSFFLFLFFSFFFFFFLFFFFSFFLFYFTS
jgi:DNA repair protein REV1